MAEKRSGFIRHRCGLERSRQAQKSLSAIATGEPAFL
jgi:hypothetical protein